MNIKESRHNIMNSIYGYSPSRKLQNLRNILIQIFYIENPDNQYFFIRYMAKQRRQDKIEQGICFLDFLEKIDKKFER